MKPSSSFKNDISGGLHVIKTQGLYFDKWVENHFDTNFFSLLIESKLDL